jgi:hypothetical protein
VNPEIQVERSEPASVAPDPEYGGDVVVLPREVDEHGRGIYDDSVVTVVKELRAEGITAEFQHAQDKRIWAGEDAVAEIALTIMLGIVSNAGWAALCRLLRKSYNEDRVRIRVARFRNKDSVITFDWYKAEGPGKSVAAALEALEPSEPGQELEKETEDSQEV